MCRCLCTELHMTSQWIHSRPWHHAYQFELIWNVSLMRGSKGSIITYELAKIILWSSSYFHMHTVQNMANTERIVCSLVPCNQNAFPFFPFGTLRLFSYGVLSHALESTHPILFSSRNVCLIFISFHTKFLLCQHLVS